MPCMLLQMAKASDTLYAATRADQLELLHPHPSQQALRRKQPRPQRHLMAISSFSLARAPLACSIWHAAWSAHS